MSAHGCRLNRKEAISGEDQARRRDSAAESGEFMAVKKPGEKDQGCQKIQRRAGREEARR
jgi:hypothetical protein